MTEISRTTTARGHVRVATTFDATYPAERRLLSVLERSGGSRLLLALVRAGHKTSRGEAPTPALPVDSGDANGEP